VSLLPPDEAAARTRARLDALAKPPGSLARLEALAVWLAAAQGRVPPTAERPRIVVFAADHGVARARGTSAYPPEVTPAMVHTFLSGRAAVAVLAANAGASLEVVDVGVVGLVGARAREQGPAFVAASLGAGTRDLSAEPAMDAETCAAAMAAGAAAVQRAAAAGADVLALGEMGIGNTTAAAALAARLLGRPAAALVGPGTGLDAAGVAHKSAVVQQALDRGGPRDPAGALADLGGFELAALAGAMLAAPAQRLPVLLDGFIVGAAALAAVGMSPAIRPWLLPASRSAEPGHDAILAALNLDPPLLDLGMRLGEASAAALALPLLRAAGRICREMATLAEVLGEPGR
jgi:nicotinate-nucleotide--dimethylbenzimidazole phosphoribosyltransferase